MEYNESNRQVLEELRLMEARLSEKFAGRCDSVERRVEERCEELNSHFTTRCDKIQDQVDVAALRGEERLIALEEMRTDIEQWRPDLIKRIEDVALEVVRVNKFFERERRAEPVDKPGIFGSYTAPPLRPPAGAPPAAGPYDHRFETFHRERESGYEFTPTHGPVKGPEFGPSSEASPWSEISLWRQCSTPSSNDAWHHWNFTDHEACAVLGVEDNISRYRLFPCFQIKVMSQ
uniref:Uncharacterized protein n=1 Tax=Zea mays TaxID=4577 RepID=B6UIR2_MAIZE|nr:hypothetical protein [Zea mays]